MSVVTMQLTGPQRAAVVLLQLGQEKASKVLAQMSDQEVEEITAEIVRMDSVAPKMADELIQDFHAQMVTGGLPVGEKGAILALLGSIERAEGLIDRIEQERASVDRTIAAGALETSN